MRKPAVAVAVLEVCRLREVFTSYHHHVALGHCQCHVIGLTTLKSDRDDNVSDSMSGMFNMTPLDKIINVI